MQPQGIHHHQENPTGIASTALTQQPSHWTGRSHRAAERHWPRRKNWQLQLSSDLAKVRFKQAAGSPCLYYEAKADGRRALSERNTASGAAARPRLQPHDGTQLRSRARRHLSPCVCLHSCGSVCPDQLIMMSLTLQ